MNGGEEIVSDTMNTKETIEQGEKQQGIQLPRELDLRDCFAAHASESEIERHREYVTEVATVHADSALGDHGEWKVSTGSYKRSAEDARYHFADAMLRARKES